MTTTTEHLAKGADMAFTATNVRLGFATNSSSSHSVVLGAGTYSHSQLVDRTETGAYGWDSFALDDTTSRVSYLATAVYQSMTEPEWVRNAVMRELFPGIDLSAGDDTYIDHQSAFSLGDWNAPAFPDLLREALEFFSDNRVTIYGGNDNDSSGDEGPYSLSIFDEHNPIRVRRDGNNYVLFNRRTGAKVRMAPEGAQFTKATRPELVDVKITDYCAAGCAFCYQSSTSSGASGDWNKVKSVINALGIRNLGVFEVAIGGGEPTAVDHFAPTINLCREVGILPSFTTFAVDWLLDDDKRAAAAECGGIGVSVHSERQLWRWRKIRKAMPSDVQVTAQHVYGSVPADVTADLLRKCGHDVPLLLLGYKPVGFGANAKPHAMATVVAEIRNKSYYSLPKRLSVDTAFVNQHPEFLDAIQARDISLTRQEGAFSCYIDAVAGQIGPSSYGSEMTNLSIPSGYRADVTPLADRILAEFRGYPGEAVKS